HKIMPGEMISLSPMHSGVNVLNNELKKYQEFMPENDDNFTIPKAITLHSLAAKALFQDAHFDRASKSMIYPTMEQLGVNFNGHVLVEQNDDELENLLHKARLQKIEEGQSKFLERAIASHGLPTSGIDISDAVKKIGEYKKKRG